MKKYLFIVLLVGFWSCSSKKTIDNKIIFQDSNQMKIGFGSCLKQNKPMPIFESIKSENFDLFLMIGDNVYGNSNTEDLKELKSAYKRQKQNFEKMELDFPFEKEIHFFLTQRTKSVKHHKGQISLPGGMRETNESLSETALRETEEEIGVNRNTVELLGSLTPFFVPATGYIIHPYIGCCKEKPSTKIYSGEVDKLFSISISELIDEKILITEEWSIRGYGASVSYYNFNLCKVWGATAAILSEFKWVLKEIDF